VKAVVAPPATTVREEPEITAADWLRETEEAQKLGITDVASACRGRAYAMEHDIPTLVAWVDGLIASGENEMARRVWHETRLTAGQKGGEELLKRIDERIAALPKAAVAPPPLAPVSVAPSLRAAYQAELDDKIGDAASIFEKELADAPEPYHLAHAASVWWQKGDAVAARKGWAAARIALREAGASFKLVPVTTWFTEKAAFHGEKLAMLRLLQPIEATDPTMSEFQLWSLGASPKRLLRSYSAASLRNIAFSDDGQWLLQADGGALLVKDVLSGVVLRRIETGEKELGPFVVAGSGEKLHVLSTAGSVVKLWNAKGEVQNEYVLEGTTPTITRVYRAGHGTMHDNILRNEPTWAVSAAISKDLRFVAAGGSDSKVRLYDRTAKTTRMLEYKWSYEERRHMGGNPDLNVPIDMRFTDRGDQLLVVYRHGQIITWGTQNGQKRRTVEGQCSVEEATLAVNQYTGPNDPRRAPTAEDRESCGRPVAARFDGALKSIATTGSGVRVRDVATGKGEAFLLGEVLSDQNLIWSPGGTLALVNIYGAVTTWSHGDKALTRTVVADAPGPIEPHFTDSGRTLWFAEQETSYVWDLVAGKQRTFPGHWRTPLLGLSSDGKLLVRRAADAVEFLDLEADRTVMKQPVPADQRAYAEVAANGKKVLLRVEQYPAMSALLCDTAAASCAPAGYLSGSGAAAISADGRWIAAEAKSGEMKVWDASNGAAAATLGKGIQQVAFSRDGSAVAWIEHPDREVRHVIAHHLRLRGEGAKPEEKTGEKAPATQDLPIDGWPGDVALSADGAEVWVLLQGSLVHWKPGVDSGTKFEDIGIIPARHVQVAENGKTVFLTGYDRVAVRANDESLRPLASLYPLLSGGFLVVSADGAVDGSKDAAEQLVTRVTRGGEVLAESGWLGWDAAHVEGLLARAVAGKSVQPTVPGANGSAATSL
jgi:WD40 repeat protein